jgi:16S rRNA (cytosine1407-C5)-methyltransferase
VTHPFDRYAAYTDLAALKKASARPLRKCLRVNTLKSSVEEFQQYAKEQDWKTEPVLWCREGFFIDREDREKALGKDLLHLLGHTYMQEASSMLPVELLNPQPGESILDMAAAPGSKTTQIGAKMRGRGVLVANDMQEKRLWTLKAALHRCGVLNVIVTKKPGQWFAKHMTERFDRVLCDAPCTAQGTIRKDPSALDYCSEASISKASKLQFQLLEAAIHACKVGGRIVYSTCTLTPEENEQLVLAIIRQYEGKIACSEPELPRLEKAIEDSQKVQEHMMESGQKTGGNVHSSVLCPLSFVRLWPHTYDTEGFFCAVLKKTASTKDVQHMESRPWKEREVQKPEQRNIADFLKSRYGFSFLQEEERLFLLGEHLHITTEGVAKFFLPVAPFSVGIPFGRKLSKSPVYISHEMTTLRGEQVTLNIENLSDAQYDQLLLGEDCDCSTELLGHVLLRYKGLCIGRGRAREGRMKNHIPREIIKIFNF